MPGGLPGKGGGGMLKLQFDWYISDTEILHIYFTILWGVVYMHWLAGNGLKI